MAHMGLVACLGHVLPLGVLGLRGLHPDSGLGGDLEGARAGDNGSSFRFLQEPRSDALSPLTGFDDAAPEERNTRVQLAYAAS